ncbi:hypothetical protein NIES4103_04080 [Nostoc sp. NIES-4103]|nr:hypothetical protein NIES4103_04080 [Nostoc sp. NIES-4103]
MTAINKTAKATFEDEANIASFKSVQQFLVFFNTVEAL